MSSNATGLKVTGFSFRKIHDVSRQVIRLFLLIVTISSVHSAEIYKWVDENGNVHFGDRPSEDQTSEKIIIKDPVKLDPVYHQHLEKQSRLLEIYDEERLESDQIKDDERKELERRKANCVKASKLLEDTRNAQYLYVNTEDPLNPRILTNEERLMETAKVEAEVTRWCND